MLFSSILIIACIGLAPISQASSYSLGVKIGDVYSWKVKYIDSGAMIEVFGIEHLPDQVGYGNQVGSIFVIKITDILVRDDYWRIIYEYSKWGSEFDQGKLSELIPMVPSSIEIWFGFSFCPMPVSEFLMKAFGGRGNYEVSQNSVLRLSHYLYKVGSKVQTLLTYTNSGILSSLKYIYNDKIIYEVVLYDAIIEVLPLILGSIALIAVIIIYVKKRKSSLLKSNQKKEVVRDNMPNALALNF